MFRGRLTRQLTPKFADHLPRKHHKPEEIVVKLRQVDDWSRSGSPLPMPSVRSVSDFLHAWSGLRCFMIPLAGV